MIIIITTNMFTSTILMFLSTVLCFVCFWFGTTCRRTYMPCGSLFCCSCVAVFHVLMANKMTMISVTLSSRLHSGRGRGKRKRWKRNEREWSKNQREEFYEKMEVGKHEWSRRGGEVAPPLVLRVALTENAGLELNRLIHHIPELSAPPTPRG